MGNKLELTWYGKDEPIRVEPRLLIEDAVLSNTAADPDTENMLIHGDNLLALKALETQFADQVKCVYIDPNCGSGGLLLKAYKKVPSGEVAVYGQELNAQAWALCTMNMFLHGVDDAKIWQGDTLSNPQNLEND